MVKVAQLSENPRAIKNKEQVLLLLKHKQAELRASMRVTTPSASYSSDHSKEGISTESDDNSENEMFTAGEPTCRSKGILPYAGRKKARHDNALVSFVPEEEEQRVVLIRKQRNEMKLLMPIMRVKNQEEIQHIQNVNIAKVEQLKIQEKLNSEQLESQQKINAAALQHQDAMQERIRLEREEHLKYEREKIRLEHDKRMLLEPKYRSDFLEVELKMKQQAEASEYKEENEKSTEAKKKALSERGRKAAATRRARAEQRERDRMEIIRQQAQASMAARQARLDAVPREAIDAYAAHFKAIADRYKWPLTSSHDKC